MKMIPEIGHRSDLRCMQEKNYQNLCHKRSEKTSRKGYQYVGYNAAVPKTHHNGMENEYKIAAGAMSNNFYKNAKKLDPK